MATLLGKLWTAMRGAATESGEAIVDANATRILDQEIRDADSELTKARDSLAELMGKSSVERNRLGEKQSKLDEYGTIIRQTLSKKEAATAANKMAEVQTLTQLANDVAGKFSALESEVKAQQALIDNYEKSIVTLKQKVVQGEATIKALKARADTVKAKEHVIRASAAVAAANSGTDTRLRSAVDGLDRLERRQEEKLAQIDAANQLAHESGDDGLNERLKQAGILPGASSTDDVLARFASKT